MAFLNPLVLLGLAAAAIPLIIHLFNFRKPKRVDFSSLTFLRELEKRTMRRVRLKQWLLLILRTLAIVCLVLAFARPTKTSVWEDVFGERSPTAMAVVIDNSLSMTRRDVQGAYLDQAKALAAALVEGAQPGDELFLVPTAREYDAGPMDFASREAALDAVEELEVHAGAETASSAVSRAASLLESAANPVREIFLISDLQATTFVDSTYAVVPDDIQLTLMPLGERDHANTAVVDVEIVSPLTGATNVFRTNELGHRGPPLVVKRPGERRILVLGDSITCAGLVWPLRYSMSPRFSTGLAPINVPRPTCRHTCPSASRTASALRSSVRDVPNSLQRLRSGGSRLLRDISCLERYPRSEMRAAGSLFIASTFVKPINILGQKTSLIVGWVHIKLRKSSRNSAVKSNWSKPKGKLGAHAGIQALEFGRS